MGKLDGEQVERKPSKTTLTWPVLDDLGRQHWALNGCANELAQTRAKLCNTVFETHAVFVCRAGFPLQPIDQIVLYSSKPAPFLNRKQENKATSEAHKTIFNFNSLALLPKFCAVNESSFKVRRALLDDLPQMTALWQSMHLPANDLAKRITEFQVAESVDGKVVGAVGMQIAERQGQVHSEAFHDFALADQLRPLFWERLNALAMNHGVWRLWTREQSPFWVRCGLAKADAEVMAKLPAPWRDQPGTWLSLKLKEDIEKVISLDKEFSLFMASEKERTRRAFQHAKVLKSVATLVAFALLAVVIVGAFLLFRRHPQLLRR